MTAPADRPTTTLAAPHLQSRAAWPLVPAVICLALGLVFGTTPGMVELSPAANAISLILAFVSIATGAIGLQRAPSAMPTPAFVGLTAAVTALLATTAFDGPLGSQPLPIALLTAPWHFALAPLTVHFAFSVAWFHHRQKWQGMVVTWYLVSATLTAAALSGLATGETVLVEVADVQFRARYLEPTGLAVALVALVIGTLAPVRRGAQRRATAWALTAVALGLGPMMAGDWLPVLATPIDGPLTSARMALAAFPLIGLLALLTLPFVNATSRDLLAHQNATALLDAGDNPTEALSRTAATLARMFEADAVTIRLAEPPLVVVYGTPRRKPDNALAVTAETLDERRALVAPIGRSAAPLGDVLIDTAVVGAFAYRERDWLAAFLVPMASALRTRHREHLLIRRLAMLTDVAAAAAGHLSESMRLLPSAPADDGLAVPPPVDAAEVLGRLGEGLTAVAGSGTEMEQAAGNSRAGVREVNDLLARALDTMRRLTTGLAGFGSHRDEIMARNQAVAAVAFRTNLLANNAGLEAGRAGSAGASFAVLATEIARLSESTREAATSMDEQATAMSQYLDGLLTDLEAARSALAAALGESEAVEDRVGELAGSATELLDGVRAIAPALEEAYAVARRRSARDATLTTALEAFLDQREELAHGLERHREALVRLGRELERLAGDRREG